MKTSTLLSLGGGALLTVSEIMPYITKIKSNGIMQLIIDSIFKSREELDQEDKDSPEHPEKSFKIKQDCNSLTLSFVHYDWKTNFLNIFKKQKVFDNKNKHLLIKNIDKKFDTIHIELKDKQVQSKL